MSEIGARLAPDCDFAVIWYYDHQDRINKISLRSFHDAVDVSEIAKEFGGGGHKKAAGFQISGELCVDDIFDIEEDDEEEELLEDFDEKSLPTPEAVEEIKEDLKNIATKAKEAGVSLVSEEIEEALKNTGVEKE
jgi:oligoribonuclease NrnB/cAMP/cGMP phosphodiesterase (DHH superfamily)